MGPPIAVDPLRLERAAEVPRQDVGGDVCRELVGGDADSLTGELRWIVEDFRRDRDDVGYSDLLHRCTDRGRARERPRSQEGQVPRVEEVFHQVNGGQNRVADAEGADVFLDPVLRPEQGQRAVRGSPIARHEQQMTDARYRRAIGDVQAVANFSLRPDPVRSAGREQRIRALRCIGDARGSSQSARITSVPASRSATPAGESGVRVSALMTWPCAQKGVPRDAPLRPQRRSSGLAGRSPSSGPRAHAPAPCAPHVPSAREGPRTPPSRWRSARACS